MPAIKKAFSLELAPDFSTTEDLETLNSFARNCRQALLAAPSTGGGWTFSLSDEP
jgi:hypothetical protein